MGVIGTLIMGGREHYGRADLLIKDAITSSDFNDFILFRKIYVRFFNQRSI